VTRPAPRLSRPEADDHVTGCGEPAPGQTQGRSCAGVGWAPSCKLCPQSPTYEGVGASERTDYAVPGYVPPSRPEPYGAGERCASCGYRHGILLPATEKCKGQERGKFKKPEAPSVLRPRPRLADPTAVRACFPSKTEWQSLLAGRARDVLAVLPSPQVPARAPQSPGEFASYRGQAAGLGAKAAARGWRVEAVYWRAADGVEGCAVRLAKAAHRAVATWKRAAGKLGAATGWSADLAYVWVEGSGDFPTKMNVTDLEGMIGSE
jgi:hypothetical protein